MGEFTVFGREGDLVFAAAAACGSAAASLSDVSIAIAGVPLPVLMAAAAGAFVVIAFAEMAWLKALAVFAGLLAAGCAGSPLLEAIALWGGRKYFEAELAVPGGLRAFAAIAISAAPYWLPKAWPVIKGFLPARFAGGSGPSSGGGGGA